jgi:hypothetical protein
MSLQDYLEARKQWDQLDSTASTAATTTTLDTGSSIPTFKPPNSGFLLQHPEEWNSIVQRHLSQTQEQPRQQPATQMPTNTHCHSGMPAVLGVVSNKYCMTTFFSYKGKHFDDIFSIV